MSGCPQCGAAILEKETNYCRECGEELSICSVCDNVLTADSSFCGSCGQSLSEHQDSSSVEEHLGESVQSDYTEVGEPNSSVGTLKGLTFGLIPGLDNSPYVKNLIGGCPSCGEGKDLTITSSTSILDFNPIKSVTDNDVDCNRCGGSLKSAGKWMKVEEGDQLIEDKLISESECIRLSKYRREDRIDDYIQLAENISNKEAADENTDKFFRVSHRLYYYPIALIMFLYGIGMTANTGRIGDLVGVGVLATLALPDVRKRISDIIGYSLPWWGRAIVAVIYGFLGLLMLFGLATL